MSERTFNQIVALLDENKIEFKVFEHAPVRTSEEAARVRNVPIESGAKALIIRSKGKFYQFILAADRMLDLNLAKAILKTNSISLASRDEVIEVTDCVPGSVPPFGNLFNIPVFADPSLAEVINFNAGLLEKSIQLSLVDWKRVVKPLVCAFGKERDAS